MRKNGYRRKCLKASALGDRGNLHTMELSSAYQQLKATEEQLYYSLKKHENLIDSMSDILWIIDNGGRIQFINDIASTILGHDRESLIAHHLFEFMCPLHQYKVGSCVNIVAQMQVRDFEREEMWMLHADGHTRKVLEVNSRRVFHEGSVIEVQGVARDITERIRLERKVKSRHRHLEILNEIGQVITSSLLEDDEQVIFENIGKKLIQALEIPLFSFRRLNEFGALAPITSLGRLKDLVQCTEIAVNTAEIKRLFASGQYVVREGLCHQVLTQKDLVQVEEGASRVGGASASVGAGVGAGASVNPSAYKTLVIPLLANGSPIGLLTVCLPLDYDRDMEALLLAVSHQLALAIEKAQLYEDNTTFYVKVIKTLIAAMEAKDIYTQGHSLRVAKYAMAIGTRMGMAHEAVKELEIAGILHDIGKIGISDSILTKAGRLTDEEFEIIREHPQIGQRILEPIGFTKAVLDAVLFHHKRFDQGGYPKDLVVEGESPYVRIIGVADAYDAMTSNRSYRHLMSEEAVLEELEANSGTQFCPEVVAVLQQLIREKGLDV